MTTVLQYLVIAAVIGLVVFGIAVVVFGRGEQLARLSPRTSPTELPDEGVTPEDLRKVRFALAVRGYRMSDVDWAVDRMADELDRLRTQVAELTGKSRLDPVATGSRPGAAGASPSSNDPGVDGPSGVATDVEPS